MTLGSGLTYSLRLEIKVWQFYEAITIQREDQNSRRICTETLIDWNRWSQQLFRNRSSAILFAQKFWAFFRSQNPHNYLSEVIGILNVLSSKKTFFVISTPIYDIYWPDSFYAEIREIDDGNHLIYNIMISGVFFPSFSIGRIRPIGQSG